MKLFDVQLTSTMSLEENIALAAKWKTEITPNAGVILTVSSSR